MELGGVSGSRASLVEHINNNKGVSQTIGLFLRHRRAAVSRLCLRMMLKDDERIADMFE